MVNSTSGGAEKPRAVTDLGKTDDMKTDDIKTNDIKTDDTKTARRSVLAKSAKNLLGQYPQVTNLAQIVYRKLAGDGKKVRKLAPYGRNLIRFERWTLEIPTG